MRVVLDTNVVVSAFLSPFGKPAIILSAVLMQDLDICFNPKMLREYEQVLTRSKFAGRLHKNEIQRFFEIIGDWGLNVDCVPSQTVFQDESDRVFFDVAKTSGAALITGNKKHYPCESFVFTPAEFLEKMHTL